MGVAAPDTLTVELRHSANQINDRWQKKKKRGAPQGDGAKKNFFFSGANSSGIAHHCATGMPASLVVKFLFVSAHHQGSLSL